jgi:hypothetical protein
MGGGAMSLFLKSLRGLFRHSSEGEQEHSRYIGPPPPFAFPRGSTSLSIQFPSAIETPDLKLIYALRKEGPQPYENLLLLTDLPKSADWPMIGSWDVDPAGKIIMELSVANTPNSPCVDMYKLRGVYPKATWNYTSGFGNQSFSYVACTSSVVPIPDTGVGGAHGPK